MAYKTSREKLNEDHAAVMRNYLAAKERERNAQGVTRTAATGGSSIETNRVGVKHDKISGIPTHDAQGRKRVSTDEEWETTPEYSRPQDPPSVERAVREGAELETQDRQEAMQRRQNRVADRKIRRDPVLRKVKASVLARGADPLQPTASGANRNRLLDDEVERQRKHEAAYQREQQQKRQRML
jgi:4-diphosphocytidyl-2C-methyl-D-erythritol kinase